jgi:hypothetical protein
MDKVNLIYKSIVGSQAYGTNIETSDVDIKGVYIQPIKEVAGLSTSYKPQIEVSKDECYFEVKRFLELSMTGNPTMLELLFMPKECIQQTSAEWFQIWHERKLFITKKCKNSFGGYAIQQIQKARALDKKVNWEKERVERKTVLDFCYISVKGPAIKLTKYLKDENIDAQYCGMVKLDHMADCYLMYHDTVGQWGADANHRFAKAGVVPTLGFKGIESKDGNQLVLSSVPKYTIPIEGVVYFNKSEWSTHCSDYNEYQKWLTSRNEARYVETSEHGQRIDGKNLMHCRRLIDTAIEIATTGQVNVRRPDREYLLSIRRGEVKLADIIDKAEKDIKRMDELFAKSDLPDEVDSKAVEELLLKVRRL